MALAVVYSRAARGLEAALISVEVHITRGVPRFYIVGLPEKEVRESIYRVRAVITHSRFVFPIKRITVNLAPADLPKEGGRFDLPIALGILAASDQIPQDLLSTHEFLSELSLSGTLRPVRGALTAALAASTSRRILVIPKKNILEASLARSATVYSASSFLDVCEYLAGDKQLTVVKPAEVKPLHSTQLNLSDICGQHHAVRALEVIASGGHHGLFIGAPGTGKTMLATRLPGILPPLDDTSAMEVMAICSLRGEDITAEKLYQRPFCAPHHSASMVALVGGGQDIRPGEITRAHQGILFLDELPEFQRQALDALREPMETRNILISRASGNVEYPASFQFIGAMNPCPDGSDVDERGRCPCSGAQLKRYYNRLSAPFLDRIDMHIRVPRIRWGQGKVKQCEASEQVRVRVLAAYRRQLERQGTQNAYMSDAEVKKYCSLSKTDLELFYKRIDQLSISARAVNRILRVARTIADLAQMEQLRDEHILEALSYRSMDKLFRS